MQLSPKAGQVPYHSLHRLGFPSLTYPPCFNADLVQTRITTATVSVTFVDDYTA